MKITTYKSFLMQAYFALLKQILAIMYMCSITKIYICRILKVIFVNSCTCAWKMKFENKIYKNMPVWWGAKVRVNHIQQIKFSLF